MIIVGSTAMQHWGYGRRAPKDLDLWLIEGEESDKEFEDTDVYYIPEILHDLVPTVGRYATPNALYTIKMSHLAWDVHWQKTKLDIIHLESTGCSIIPMLYNKLNKHWAKDYGTKEFLKMNKTKDEFFTDMVYYRYDHDELHKLVSFPEEPVYNRCLKDNQDVMIDKNKFNLLTHSDKIRMFREEITVIACERWLFNDKNNVNSWFEAYSLSLKKTIISLTKGWATDFIVQNLKEFIKPEYAYFEHILNKLEYSMSVNMKVFEDLLGEGGSMEEMIYLMCENDWIPDIDFTFKTKSPPYSLHKSDPVEYERLSKLRRDEYDEYRKLTSIKSDELGYKHLEQEGGGEGGSEYCHGVFSLMGKTYMAEYQYYSHNGHEYSEIVDTIREVKPVEKTITVYE